MELTPQNATITTATVEVKALTIGGKQVTLAVFRQLDRLSLLAPDGSLRGKPWGRINHHPDKECKVCGNHVHVVWQRGDRLFRDFIATAYGSTISQVEHARALPQLFIGG